MPPPSLWLLEYNYAGMETYASAEENEMAAWALGMISSPEAVPSLIQVLKGLKRPLTPPLSRM